MLSINEIDISKQNVKLPFTGSTPVNATEEMEEKSDAADVTTAVVSSTEMMKETKDNGGVTNAPQAKIEEVSHGAIATTTSPNVPDALVYKYNRYCDRIYERIGAILKQSYDPVNVRLSTSITHKTVKKTTQKQKKKKR